MYVVLVGHCFRRSKALKQAEDDLANVKKTNEEKAIAVCWILHLVGDIHQPLHCTTYYSKDFPDGDTGGNDFLIGSTNLHSFWDEILGADHVAFSHLESVGTALHRSAQFQRSKLAELKETRPDQWAVESNELAKTSAYRDGILDGANKKQEHDHGSLNIPPLPEGYRQQALNVAQKRVVLAGYRLADKLSALFP
jgi:hypothetical protein